MPPATAPRADLQRKMDAFLLHRRRGSTVAQALERAGLDQGVYYKALQRWPHFRELAEAAKDLSRQAEVLEPPDFPTFRKLCFGHDSPPHMGKIIAHLMDPECKRLLVLVPPEHAKTSLVDTEYLAWLLARESWEVSHGLNNPPVRAAVISETSTFAQTVGWQLRQSLTDAGLYPDLHTYGPFRTEKTKWSERSIYAHWRDAEEKDPSVQWLGHSNQLQGSRLTHVILDDVDAPGTSHSEREALLLKLDHTIGRRLGQDGKLIVIGTRVSEDDFYSELLRRVDAGYWHSVILPALNEDGEPLWPGRFTAEYFAGVRAEMDNDRLFNLVYLQEAGLGMDAIFNPQIVDRAKVNVGLGKPLERSITIAALDPALDGRWACSVVSYDRQADKIRLVDMLAGKGGGYEAMEKAVHWAVDNYKPQHFVIEKQGGVSLFLSPAIKDYIAGHHARLHLVSTTAQGISDLYYGVSALAHWMAKGQVELPWHSSTVKTIAPLIDELTSYRSDPSYKGAYDRVMSLWFCFRIVLLHCRTVQMVSFGTARKRAPWIQSQQRTIHVGSD